MPEGQSAPDGLPLGTFFTFRGRVYLGNMGRLQPGDAWPFLLRYVPAADRAAPDSVFEVVAQTHPEVVPAGETTNVLDEAEEVGAGDSTRLVWRGGCALYTTLDLTAARTRRVALPAGTCASEIARVGDSLYVLARPARPDATTSVLLVTADGRTFAERFRADGPWLLSLAWARDPGAPPGQGAFYFGSLGLPPAPSLYRLRYPLARPPARDGW